MEAPVEWKELRDGQVGKVGPGHLNHLEGGGGVYEGRKRCGVCVARGGKEDMHHAESRHE